jgi:hypothetical protein
VAVGAATIFPDLEGTQVRESKKENSRKKGEVYFKYFDCADLSHLESNFASVVDELGGPDVFINYTYFRNKGWGKAYSNGVNLWSAWPGSIYLSRHRNA